MIDQIKVDIGIALMLASTTVLNRYAPGELLRLAPAEIGARGFDPVLLAGLVERIADALRVENCLPRALALREVLRQNGVNAQVVLSVSYGGTFHGHAWVSTPNHGRFFHKDGLVPWVTLPVNSGCFNQTKTV